MVSISKSQSPTQAQSYYTQENYYLQESELGFFHGQLLTDLGLVENEKIDIEKYNKLLLGVNPKNDALLLKNSNDIERRAGFDVTFSAPKSVSILVEALEINSKNDDAKLIRAAHEKAVQSAMKEIEKEFAKTRVRTPGGREKVHTSIAWSSFQHDISRELDAQLHTHNFIFNLAKVGKRWYSLSNEEIFKNKMYLGQYYRNELAKNLSELGYKTEVTDRKQGFFELVGFNKDVLQEFSRAHNKLAIKFATTLQDLKKQYSGANEEKLKELINLTNRPKKEKQTKSELQEINKIRLETFGIDSIFLNDYKKYVFTETEQEVSANEHLNKAINNLSETKSVFTKEDIIREALKYGLNEQIGVNIYHKAILENKQLIELEEKTYSTQDMIDKEKEIIAIMQRGNFANFSFIEDEKLNDFISDKFSSMTKEQQNMFNEILTCKEQILCVQGDAGTGKTFSAKAIKDYMDEFRQDIEIVGLSFTGKAVEGLEKDSQIKSQTIHSFVYAEQIKKEQAEQLQKQRLLIVDEAGMVGSRQMHEIFKIAEKNNDKIVLIGDIKQFSSIAAGNIFEDLQRFGANTIKLQEVMRQKTKHTKELISELKAAYFDTKNDELTKDDKFKKFDILFKKLESKKLLQETKNRDDTILKITDKFMSLRDENKNKTIILASNNKDRKELNKTIRKQLKQDGYNFNVLEPISTSGIDKHYSDMYQVGNLISLGLKKEQFEIVTIKDDKTIIIKDKQEQEQEINVYENGDNIIQFNKNVLNLAADDKIIFTKNLTKKDFKAKNGEIDTISKLDFLGNIETKSGKKFNIKDYPYLDHAYAITDVKSQGMTANNVLVMANSEMTNFNSFYVQLTRAKTNFLIFTQNKDELKEKIKRTAEIKTTLTYLNKGVNYGREIGNNTEQNAGNQEQPISNNQPTNNFRKTAANNTNLFRKIIRNLATFIKSRRQLGRPNLKELIKDKDFMKETSQVEKKKSSLNTIKY